MSVRVLLDRDWVICCYAALLFYRKGKWCRKVGIQGGEDLGLGSAENGVNSGEGEETEY